jgi:hypothetical protein
MSVDSGDVPLFVDLAEYAIIYIGAHRRHWRVAFHIPALHPAINTVVALMCNQCATGADDIYGREVP